MSSSLRGLAPREGLGSVLMKMGRAGPPFEPRRGPQAGKSGDPRSQNTDSSPRAQGALGLGFEEKPKGKCGAPRAAVKQVWRPSSEDADSSPRTQGALGQVRSAAGPNSLRPWSTHDD